MRRLIGSCIFYRQAAQLAPSGYVAAPGGSGYFAGRLLPGPDVDTNTTVCLLDGDDGVWFRQAVELRGGTVGEEQSASVTQEDEP